MSGDGGSLTLSTGHGFTNGADITLSAGGNKDGDSDATPSGGNQAGLVGGAISLTTGSSAQYKSGGITLSTVNGNADQADGGSGDISITAGSGHLTSGAISLATGAASSGVAGGVAQALLTTQIGLIIAAPGIIAFRYVEGQAKKVIQRGAEIVEWVQRCDA